MSCRSKLEDLADTGGMSGEGRMQLRVDSPSDLAAFLAVECPARLPALLFEAGPGAFPRDWDLPQVKGLKITRARTQKGLIQVAITALESSFWEPFVAVADDILPRISAAGRGTTALKAIRQRLLMWAHFFDRAPSGKLERAERLGLIGELYALDRYLLEKAGDQAISGWRGPEHEVHDFLFGNVAIEVKCTCSQQPVQLDITSARQLDGEGFASLYLFGVWLSEGPTGLVSLPDLVEAVRSRTAHAYPGTIGRFEDLLIHAGYLDAHREEYAAERFNLKGAEFFVVKDGFPRLREVDVPTGVGHLRYTIDWSACMAFRTPPETVLQEII
jgi:hypothetical protein